MFENYSTLERKVFRKVCDDYILPYGNGVTDATFLLIGTYF
jgi:hypothetical protein